MLVLHLFISNALQRNFFLLTADYFFVIVEFCHIGLIFVAFRMTENNIHSFIIRLRSIVVIIRTVVRISRNGPDA